MLLWVKKIKMQIEIYLLNLKKLLKIQKIVLLWLYYYKNQKPHILFLNNLKKAGYFSCQELGFHPHSCMYETFSKAF